MPSLCIKDIESLYSVVCSLRFALTVSNDTCNKCKTKLRNDPDNHLDFESYVRDPDMLIQSSLRTDIDEIKKGQNNLT